MLAVFELALRHRCYAAMLRACSRSKRCLLGFCAAAGELAMAQPVFPHEAGVLRWLLERRPTVRPLARSLAAPLVFSYHDGGVSSARSLLATCF